MLYRLIALRDHIIQKKCILSYYLLHSTSTTKKGRNLFKHITKKFIKNYRNAICLAFTFLAWCPRSLDPACINVFNVMVAWNAPRFQSSFTPYLFFQVQYRQNVHVNHALVKFVKLVKYC